MFNLGEVGVTNTSHFWKDNSIDLEWPALRFAAPVVGPERCFSSSMNRPHLTSHPKEAVPLVRRGVVSDSRMGGSTSNVLELFPAARSGVHADSQVGDVLIRVGVLPAWVAISPVECQ
eukprot:2425807-Pyramimonas_sp.AAC.1